MADRRDVMSVASRRSRAVRIFNYAAARLCSVVCFCVVGRRLAAKFDITIVVDIKQRRASRIC